MTPSTEIERQILVDFANKHKDFMLEFFGPNRVKRAPKKKMFPSENTPRYSDFVYHIFWGKPFALLMLEKQINHLRITESIAQRKKYKPIIDALDQERRQLILSRDKEIERVTRYAFIAEKVNNLSTNALRACENSIFIDCLKITYEKGGTDAWQLFCHASPLLIAINAMQPVTVAYLLECGLDYKTGSALDMPAYEQIFRLKPSTPAIQQMQALMTERLLTDLASAPSVDNIEWMLRAFYFNKALINTPIPECHGITPAMLFVITGRVSALKWCAKHVDFDMQDELGRTMFDHALVFGQKEVLDWLLSKAKFALSNLELACKTGNLKALKKILAVADKKLAPQLFESALYIAVMYGFHAGVKTLIAAVGANVERRNSTIFLIAAERQDLKMMQILSDHGAHVAVAKGQALSKAIAAQDEFMIEQLVNIDSMYDFAKRDFDRFSDELKQAGIKKTLAQFRTNIEIVPDYVKPVPKPVTKVEHTSIPAKKSFQTEFDEDAYFVALKLRSKAALAAHKKGWEDASNEQLYNIELAYLGLDTDLLNCEAQVMADRDEQLAIIAKHFEYELKKHVDAFHFYEGERQEAERTAERKKTQSICKAFAGVVVGCGLGSILAPKLAASAFGSSAFAESVAFGGISSATSAVINGSNPLEAGIKGMLTAGLVHTLGEGLQAAKFLSKLEGLGMAPNVAEQVFVAVKAAGGAMISTAVYGGKLSTNIAAAVASNVASNIVFPHGVVPEAVRLSTTPLQKQIELSFAAFERGVLIGGIAAAIGGADVVDAVIAASSSGIHASVAAASTPSTYKPKSSILRDTDARLKDPLAHTFDGVEYHKSHDMTGVSAGDIYDKDFNLDSGGSPFNFAGENIFEPKSVLFSPSKKASSTEPKMFAKAKVDYKSPEVMFNKSSGEIVNRDSTAAYESKTAEDFERNYGGKPTTAKILWLYATKQLLPGDRRFVASSFGGSIAAAVERGEAHSWGRVRAVKSIAESGLSSCKGLLYLNGSLLTAKMALSLVPDTAGQFAFDAGMYASGVALAKPLASSTAWLWRGAKSGFRYNAPLATNSTLTKGQIVDYLQNIDKVPMKQLATDLEKIGLKLLERRPDKQIYKFSHVKNELREVGNVKAKLESSKVMVEIHFDAKCGPHMHITDTKGHVYDKHLNNLTDMIANKFPNKDMDSIIKKSERLPEAHIKIKEFVELNLRLNHG